MTGKRRYDDSCGMAQGLNLVGDRWALHVARELLLGPKRFADLRSDLPGISSNVLAQRLVELEERGVVRRRLLPRPAAAWVYELTPWGAELEPIILELGRWAARSPAFDNQSPLSGTSAVLSMRTMFRPAAADGVTLRIGLQLGDLTVLASVDHGVLDAVRVESLEGSGRTDSPAVVVATTPEILARLLFADADLDALLENGLVRIDGDRPALERYLGCFQLPEPVAR